MNTDKKIPTKDLPGWLGAPLPPCKGGDERGLVWCCKIDKGGNCRRDEYLRKIGILPEEFIRIKEEFSKEKGWDSEDVCWKSLAYCCMRFDATCLSRDKAIQERCPGKDKNKALEEYYSKKKDLAEILMGNAKEKKRS